MFCDHVLSVAIAVTGCLCFSRLQYRRLLAKEGKNACMGNQKGPENEKSTTRGIPRQSPISLECRRFRIGARDRKFELVIVNSPPYWLGKSEWGKVGGEGKGVGRGRGKMEGNACM